MSGAGRGADMGRVSAVLQVLLQGGKPVFAATPATGELAPVSPHLAAAPHGFLPLLLAAGDTVWRETTGRSLGVELRRDPDTVLGFRAERIAPGPATPVLLSVMEAIAQAEGPEMLVLDDLKAGWTAAQERMRRTAQASAPPPAAVVPSAFPPASSFRQPPARRGGPRP